MRRALNKRAVDVKMANKHLLVVVFGFLGFVSACAVSFPLKWYTQVNLYE